ncbi:MAG: DHH family phosphoesterase [Candidatus Micrarchaeota archaeon]
MVNLTEGSSFILDAMVTNSRPSGSLLYYEITDGIITYNFFYDKFLNKGDIIKLDSTIKNPLSFSLSVNAISSYKDNLALEKRKEIEEKMMDSLVLPKTNLFVQDPTTTKILPLFEQIARYLHLVKRSNKFVLLKYHNDADGICAALSITSFLKCRSEQQKSAVYSEKDAVRDLETITNETNPVVVFVDFGASIESQNGLKLLKAGGATIIIIDHHPPSKEISNHSYIFVSPWAVSDESESSRYPAGYLCAEIAKYFTNDDSEIAKLNDYAKIACAGDKSKILEITEQDRRKALALDYIALYGGYPNLSFYKKILSSPDILSSILEQAEEKLNAILSNAKRRMIQKDLPNVTVYLLELEGLTKQYEFPSKGKAATTIFEALVKENPTKPIIVIGYGKQTVVIRINDLAAEAGYSGKEIAETTKTTMKDFVESAGGHQKAAAVRVKKEFAKSVAEELVKIIEGK